MCFYFPTTPPKKSIIDKKSKKLQKWGVRGPFLFWVWFKKNKWKIGKNQLNTQPTHSLMWRTTNGGDKTGGTKFLILNT